MWEEYDCSISFPGSIDNANFELLCHESHIVVDVNHIEVKMKNNLESNVKYNLPMYIHDRNIHLFHQARKLFF